MIREKWEQILNNTDVRQNLSKIRQEIKEQVRFKSFLTIIQGSEDILIALLEEQDAKTRKNTALLMGDLGSQQFLTPLWEAYQREQQRFVRSSYLTAIGALDYRAYLEPIREQLDILKSTEMTEENRKHITEEMRELSALLVRIEGIRSHTFTGWNDPHDIVLLTNRNYAAKTGEELAEHDPQAVIKLFGAGIMAQVTHLQWVRKIRTYQELLFAIRGTKTCPMDPDQIAAMIAGSRLLPMLSQSHDGSAPFYFRVELKSKRDLKQKSAFIKKLSARIEQATDRQLINTKDQYEFELRLIENKEGNCNILMKLYTLKDKRFSYRQEVMPTSIKPVNAALAVTLAKDYLRKDAQILDPFCGVGTMLIERNKAVMANTTYGIDIEEEAIQKARKNTKQAGQIIHYVNRDFFRFRHDYLFDEVVTNMPFQIGRVMEDEVSELYDRFFRSIPGYIKKGAILILYSHDREIVRRITARTEFCVLEEFEISRRERTYVFVIKYME